ncbi:alpha-endosulfine [Podarcis muralis]
MGRGQSLERGRWRRRPFWLCCGRDGRARRRGRRSRSAGLAWPQRLTVSPACLEAQGPVMSDTLGGGGDARSDETGEEKQDSQEKEVVIPERAEEAKLKAKYPSLGLQKPGGSDFLMKRLQKGQKYFDSGDYNMAKAKIKNKQLPTAGTDKNLVTGDHIPTPQDLPQRKSSLVTSKLAG